ncbi:MMPL family transporter [uncultured Shewanella sp.]|uniref:MMPL family transporter n=1 Tax=uncultured Shewanella sp. TaxID=173975 RepID=UPI00260A0143|nr:MMPL family transporter [uncultured Shewanella sp.]
MAKLVSWFNSPKQAYSRFIIWCLLVISVCVYGASLWQSGAKIQSNILAMLPTLSEAPLTQKALDKVEFRLADQVYIGLAVENKQQAISAATQFIEQLQQSPDVFTDIQSGESKQMQALSQYYFDKRFMLLTDEQQKQLSDDEGSNQWRQLLQAAQQQLYSSFGYASSALLTQDPLMLFPNNIMALAPSKRLTSEQDILLGQSGNKTVAIIIAKGVKSAFNPDGQQQQIARLNDAFSELTLQYPDIEVIKAGTLFHAQAATQTAKFEVSTIGSLSLLGVMLLVWLGFRSIMPLSLAMLTLSCGFLFATVATLAIFGELHLLTLVFGTSLIGVAIDYSFHFYCEKLRLKISSATDVIQQILPAMTLALLTSAIAFIAIGFTPFPGMQQVAIFCAAGLIGAYLTLVFAYPLLANHNLPTSPYLLVWSEKYLLWLTKFTHNVTAQQSANKPLKMALLALATVAFLTVGFSKLTSNDDIRNLQQSPANIITEENKLRQVLSGGTDNQFILVSAATEQSLLAELTLAAKVLSTAVNAKEISSFVSLSRYLPSKQIQQDNYLAYQQLYHQHLDEIIDTLGLDESIKPDLLNSLAQSKNDFITPDAVLDIAGKDLAGLWLSPDVGADTGTDIGAGAQSTQFGSIILLGGINDLAALNLRVTQSKLSMQVVDKVGEISALMAKFKQLTLQLLVLVCVIAIGIFSFKFGVKLAVRIVMIPASSILLTLACLGLVGSPLSLFHALALILVLGIGIDYSLFFASVKSNSTASASGVMMAVLMSACSTLLAFGLLALSQTNAIHYFGLTLLFGIGFTFLLAPLISMHVEKTTREVAHNGK